MLWNSLGQPQIYFEPPAPQDFLGVKWDPDRARVPRPIPLRKFRLLIPLFPWGNGFLFFIPNLPDRLVSYGMNTKNGFLTSLLALLPKAEFKISQLLKWNPRGSY
jgi:hypothetical protein